MIRTSGWSIRQVFLFVQAVVIGAIVLVLISNAFIINQFNGTMGTILEKNDALNNVFQYNTQVQEHAYKYLRHQSTAVEEYPALKADFYREMNALYDSVHLERTRIFLWGLRNMFTGCFGHVEAIMAYTEAGDGDAAYAEYQALLKACTLIDDTVNSYHTLYSTDLKSYLEEVSRSTRIQSAVVMVINVVIIVVITLVLLRQTSNIRRQIDTLRAYAGQISRRDYAPVMEHRFENNRNELDNLGSAMQQMAGSIQGYIEKIAEKDRKVIEMTRLENEYLRVYSSARDAEIRALNSQINPHFLFNTLGVVSQLCYIEGAERASEMLDSVIDTFQYMTRTANAITDLHSEIDFLNQYVFICKVRYENQISFAVTVEEDLPNLKLPGIIVQPIVENAILHGLKNCIQGGLVHTHFYSDDEHIYIQVEDNGSGIDYEGMEHVISSSAVEPEHVGIQNVLKRLKLYFGDEADINITSEEGCGTIVTIVIPNR